MQNKKCIICEIKEFVAAFPFNTYFNKRNFYYKRCLNCSFVKIDPYPNKNDLKNLYNNKSYHEKFYSNTESKEYKLSAKYLKNFVKKKIKLLDFGCGNGQFIKEVQNKYKCYGVEYDLETIKKCKKSIKNAYFFHNTIIDKKKFINFFDLVHLGDVLEHVVNPINLLYKLEKIIKKNGLLYVEGPIERNFSVVNFSIILFGNIKKFLKPNLKNNFMPYHLYFCNFNNQLLMLKKIKKYKIVKYEIYETGWPYNNGGLVKTLIARLAIIFSKINIFGFKIGNRFRIVLKKI